MVKHIEGCSSICLYRVKIGVVDRDSSNNKCALCGKILFTNKPETIKKEIIDGIHYFFDTKDCAIMFKRFRSVYDNKFNELLGQKDYVSDPFWNKVIPSEKEIKEIEKENAKSDILQIIRDPAEVQKLGFELVRSAKEEVLVMFSTANAFHRQERIGGIHLLSKMTAAKRGLHIRILTPADARIKEIASEVERQQQKVEVRYIEESLRTEVTVLIRDRKYSLAVELRDDTNDMIHSAIELATYSNSNLLQYPCCDI